MIFSISKDVEIERLEEELKRYKTVIHKLLGNGGDEEVWPSGIDSLMALENYVEKLQKDSEELSKLKQVEKKIKKEKQNGMFQFYV